MTGETEDNHTEPQLRQPVARFEPGTSRIELGNVIAWFSRRFQWRDL